MPIVNDPCAILEADATIKWSGLYAEDGQPIYSVPKSTLIDVDDLRSYCKLEPTFTDRVLDFIDWLIKAW